MTDSVDKDKPISSQDSLVDALESIKSLLEKSDAKLAAARESIAIASNQTERSSVTPKATPAEQFEIPVLDDVVIPAEGKTTESVAPITQQEEQYASIQSDVDLDDYFLKIQKELEKTLRDSLMKKIVTIESGIKKELHSEIERLKAELKK